MVDATNVEAQKVVEFARKIISTPGETGREHKICHVCAVAMEDMGFDEVFTDGLNNVVGILRGTGSGVIQFDGHIDTVGITDEAAWTVPPYGGVVKDGKIYGRGASDMRGAFAAMMAAAGSLVNDRPEATIVVTGTSFEEVAEGFCMQYLLDNLAKRDLTPNLVVIGEASELRLNRGQRGRAGLSIEAHGKTAHSSSPQRGLNAVTAMMPVLAGLERRSEPTHSLLGRGSSVVTAIISRPYPGVSVVPDLCTLTLDRRLLPGETREAVLAEFRAVTDAVTREHPEYKYSVRLNEAAYTLPDGRVVNRDSFAPAWELPEDHAYVRMGLSALKQAGVAPAIGHYSFCTNGSGSMGERGIPTLGFGPSYEHLAHVVDEYIEIDQLLGAYAGYQSLMRNFRK